MLTREQFQLLYDQGPDAVFAFVVALQEHLASQQQQIAALSARVQELEARLSKDSHNSSKPPSSDGLSKKPVSLRERTGRKPGAQKGHPGRTLCFVQQPHQIVSHSPAQCLSCGAELAQVPAQLAERRQVLDLPPLSLYVTEHQVHCKACPQCGCISQGAFPPDVSQPTQYGPRLKALGLYLLDYQLLPYARVAQLFADLLDAPLSSGTLYAAQQSTSLHLQPVVEAIRQAISRAPVAHFDESGLRVAGRLHWLHSASTATLTYYTCQPKRGQVGMEQAGVLPSFSGRAVHDGWASYFAYDCPHALCNAHHLRELRALAEQGQQSWATDLQALLVEGKQAVEEAKASGATCLTSEREADLQSRYFTLLAEGLQANPAAEARPGRRGRPKQSAARNLLERLQRFAGETLAFVHDFSVPFDNNLAERDVRMIKVKQKVSGCFRTKVGADAFCRLRSYIATLRKQGHNVLAVLELAIRGRPVYPEGTA